ncbi:MAG TPA: glycoside hydrolase family 16 protein [Chitinophagaceae bacterium]|nr:glycoside hydrolase family 16 protein [Chitinophagaceae bacterium]
MRLTALLPAIAIIANITVAGAQTGKGKWKLVWTEDFTGKHIDTNIWNYEVNDFGGGNHEYQYYTARDTNAYVKDGLLHIRGLKEDYKTRHYTSARLTTRHKIGFTFGRMEIRAKIPTGKGMWPAIWMMSTDEKYGSWPLSGEIDIMETKGQYPDTLYGTAHFGPAPPHNRWKGELTEHEVKDGWGDGFHVYSIDWRKDTITWYVDGVKYHQVTKGDVTNIQGVPYPFNEQFYFILNMAIGGDFVGGAPDDAALPKEFLVDYIKVYQRK